MTTPELDATILAIDLFGGFTGAAAHGEAREETGFRLWTELSRFLADHGRARAELIGHLINDKVLGTDPREEA